MSMSRGFGLAIVVLAVAGGGEVGFCGSFCDAWSGRPDFGIHGLCFSPYKDGNRPPDYVPVEQIRERLEIVAPYTEWVRSFSATSGLEEIPEEANELGLKVAMGAWIRHEAVRDEEIDNLIEKAEAGYVDVAVVGNEELWWGEHGKADAIDPCELVLALETVRQRLDDANLSHIPVTTADPWDALFKRNGTSFKYQEVLDAVDVFYVNMYPFHEDTHISRAIEKLEETYSAVLVDANEAGPGKEVIIGETGWPSEEEHWGSAKPSLANAARYFYEAQCWAARNDVKMFWFAAFDEKWKAEPTADEDPPDYEAHWGIWDANGDIKPSFMPDHVFCEDFDPPTHPFCPRIREEDLPPEPNTQSPDPNSDGEFLRLLYDGNFSRYSAVAFDRVAAGAFCRIIAEFDFRMYGPDPNEDADGFSFLLLPTSENDVNGCSTYSYYDFLPDFPRLPKTFAVAFSVYDDNEICVSWDEEFYPSGTPNAVSIDFDSGDFHRARIELLCSNNNTALVTVMVTLDIYDSNHGESITIFDNIPIGDPNHPYAPYENRVEFAGRNGGLDINADIDNIHVSYKFQVCNYVLPGDVNGDCRVNLLDFAVLARNWLINCDSTPDDPACVPK